MSDQTPAAATKRPPLIAVLMSYGLYALLITVLCAVLFLLSPALVAQYQQYFMSASAPKEQVAPAGNVGGQAPPAVRGTNAEVVVQPPVARPAISTPFPGVAQNAATAQVMYDAAVQAAQPVAAPTMALPQNDAGAPVIDQVQQEQLNQSLGMALDEGMTAAEAPIAAERQAMYTAVAQRPPDVSYQDAAAMLHRDPCHVPRADPATCARGLFKPTPVQP